jgi:mono/diheme cytochrome c family protein
MAVVGAPALMVSAKATAQDMSYTEKDVERGKKIFAGKASCPFCHGWSGDGRGDARAEGAGVSLRLADLTFEQIYEVIECGRPYAAMPYHDRFAYSDGRCYGLTEEELGKEGMPPRATKTLQKHEIKAVAAYVTEKIIGRGLPVYYEECVEYFGEAPRECDDHPKSTEIETTQ